ncbi:HAD domain-containing protein [Nocardia jiangsuensis]|uniref:HAD domain-containing protein n=1 Tax=Nocardia jiangsuensis TaxID=1691563 RepID=A0ABV8DJZ3_9NOCA
MRPLLFLDVDGTLIPFGPTHPAAPGPDRIDRRITHRLAALPCALVWATTWTDPNRDLCPHLSWPPLPTTPFPDPTPAQLAEDRWFGLHWKTRALSTRAASSPFAWLDDELTTRDRDWLQHHHPAPTLLIRVDSARGVGSTELHALECWCAGVSRPPAAAPPAD